MSEIACFAEFAKHPVACLTLASFLASNTGDVARKHIKEPELLKFIDIECYCWSTVLAGQAPAPLFFPAPASTVEAAKRYNEQGLKHDAESHRLCCGHLSG